MKTTGIWQSRKKVSQLRGKLRQKVKNGPYYYRLMVANGIRREFALKTCDFEEACRKAAELDAVWEAPTHLFTIDEPDCKGDNDDMGGIGR